MIRTKGRFSPVMRVSDMSTMLRSAGKVMLVLLLTGACGGGKKAATNGDVGLGTSEVTTATVPSTTVRPSTASPSRDAAATVEAAYREATAAEIQFDSEVGPFDPRTFKERVGRFLTGTQYEASFQISQQRRLRGEVFRPAGLQPDEIAPVVTMDGPSRATVRDCAADHATVVATSGERVDEPIEGRELILVEMVLENGQWKIANSTATGQSCTA